jgi:ubiquinone/menaquinone biosynthesis C-methylase UbiE
MTTAGIALLRCPGDCGGGVTHESGEVIGGELEEGELGCGVCGRRFAVTEGIARMLPTDLCEAVAESEESEKKRTEMQARDAQVDDYDRMWHLNLFGLVEIPAMLANLSLSRTHRLLEAGCGTGRMTPGFARRCKHLVSIDFSWESLRACRSKLVKAGIRNVDLVQADICRLPLATAAFDRVVSGQVLEHIPTPAAREAAVAELARVLASGGNLVISAYQYSLLMRLFGEKEGEHAGGIYFFRFTRDELRALLSRNFNVQSISGALVYHYIARCRKERE